MAASSESCFFMKTAEVLLTAADCVHRDLDGAFLVDSDLAKLSTGVSCGVPVHHPSQVDYSVQLSTVSGESRGMSSTVVKNVGAMQRSDLFRRHPYLRAQFLSHNCSCMWSLSYRKYNWNARNTGDTELFIGWRDDHRRLVCLGLRDSFYPEKSVRNTHCQFFATMAGIQAGLSCSWILSLRLDSSPLLRMHSSPSLICKFLAIRDIPDGKKRRSALLHWVSAHQRRPVVSADDEDAAIEVRRYLRGAREATYGAMRFDIAPPAESEPELLSRLAIGS